MMNNKRVVFGKKQAQDGMQNHNANNVMLAQMQASSDSLEAQTVYDGGVMVSGANSKIQIYEGGKAPATNESETMTANNNDPQSRGYSGVGNLKSSNGQRPEPIFGSLKERTQNDLTQYDENPSIQNNSRGGDDS